MLCFCITDAGAVNMCKEIKQGHWHNILLRLQHPHEAGELLYSYITREIPKPCLVKSVPKYYTCKNPFLDCTSSQWCLMISPFCLLPSPFLLKPQHPQVLSKRSCMGATAGRARAVTREARKGLMGWSLNVEPKSPTMISCPALL